MTAFVIGNGCSRIPVNLRSLKGKTYGCNALYKDFCPDVLVATDEPISRAIQDLGYAKSRRFHTRKVYGGSGAIPLKPPYSGWSSGPNALQLAVQDGNKDIYIIGFDFGSNHTRFNNVYANTEFYRKSHETATFSGNWHNQVETIIKHNPKVNFVFVEGPETKRVIENNKYKNVKFIQITEFLKIINNV
jgi:hypothetical protein